MNSSLTPLRWCASSTYPSASTPSVVSVRPRPRSPTSSRRSPRRAQRAARSRTTTRPRVRSNHGRLRPSGWQQRPRPPGGRGWSSRRGPNNTSTCPTRTSTRASPVSSAFIEAGADCVYAPGVTDPEQIRAICSLTRPANILLSAATPTVDALAGPRCPQDQHGWGAGPGRPRGTPPGGARNWPPRVRPDSSTTPFPVTTSSVSCVERRPSGSYAVVAEHDRVERGALPVRGVDETLDHLGDGDGQPIECGNGLGQVVTHRRIRWSSVPGADVGSDRGRR